MIKLFLFAILLLAMIIGIIFLTKINIIFVYILLFLIAFSLICAYSHAAISSGDGRGH